MAEKQMTRNPMAYTSDGEIKDEGKENKRKQRKEKKGKASTNRKPETDR